MLQRRGQRAVAAPHHVIAPSGQVQGQPEGLFVGAEDCKRLVRTSQPSQ
jgi:hypothetical protein